MTLHSNKLLELHGPRKMIDKGNISEIRVIRVPIKKGELR